MRRGGVVAGRFCQGVAEWALPESARLVKIGVPFWAGKPSRRTRICPFCAAAWGWLQQKIDFLWSIPGSFPADRGINSINQQLNRLALGAGRSDERTPDCKQTAGPE